MYKTLISIAVFGILVAPQTAIAGGVEPLIGEIKLFSGSYAPRGWMYCEGQKLNIQEHQHLYVIIGTRYGGKGSDIGKTTFCLPNMKKRETWLRRLINQKNAPRYIIAIKGVFPKRN